MLAGCSDELDRHDSFFLSGLGDAKEIPAHSAWGGVCERTYSLGTDESSIV